MRQEAIILFFRLSDGLNLQMPLALFQNLVGIVGLLLTKTLLSNLPPGFPPEFKLYLIIEFQRLKDEESNRLKLDWNLQRTLSKINYRIHTDAIKEKLVPPELTREQMNIIYANEADLLNMALFGLTARDWREANPKLEGNIREF